MKKWFILACIGAIALGSVTYLYVHGYFDSKGVKEASTAVDVGISTGRWELDEAYRKVELQQQATITKVETVRREVKESVEAMDDDDLLMAWEFELALHRNRDREGAAGLDSTNRGIFSNGAGSEGNRKRITRAPVNSGDLGGGLY